ncbi:phage replisome organizer N-terminal domain-containing protein [Leuconostoc suionicum]|uniref:phage replisome organizer N-terminal domain-containing protein n=1 Tax=Leuconostoc suionicum TaxID=1511761 RepID=UPI0024AC9BB2|nr:phage replisome organizer N-terminal domain-containing protein [Leuconostoc suionicum]MDI6503130.1 phage replisome organizer N-terminal domain-containing protein [Leuconostoc suionicum]MDI6665998.1 phage replisome organizer N-terminal domain-containing protein [Leuconostoc suionicum]
MATKKKPIYFWLRLDNNFYKNLAIKKARKMAGGDTMVVIYQKMMLSSLDTNGVIYYEGVYGKLEEELALMIDEETEQVAMTLAYFTKAGLIQIDDSQNVEMSQVSALIDQETNWARYKREQRKNNKLDNVQPVSNERPTEIDIELEKDIDIKKELDVVANEETENGNDDKSKAYSALVHILEQNGFGTIGGIVSTDINKELDDFAEANNGDYREAYSVILQAIKISVGNGVCKFKYLWNVTRDWYQRKLFTLKDIEASEKKRDDEKSKSKQRGYNNKPQRVEPQMITEPVAESNVDVSDVAKELAELKEMGLKTKLEE